MAGIAQNGQKRLIFIEAKKVKGKHNNIYPHVYIHTPTDTKTYINTATSIHTYTLFITQVT